MSVMTIIRDTRERKPWEFEGYSVDLEDRTLETGDYTLAEFCEHDEELDTYHPRYAIERKSGSDFLNSIGRERFKDEIKRANNWESNMLVLVEAQKSPSRYEDNFWNHGQMTRKQIFGIVDRWEQKYNVSFQFAGNRDRAQQVAYDTLQTHLRASLMG